jgi:hypothetical protein
MTTIGRTWPDTRVSDIVGELEEMDSLIYGSVTKIGSLTAGSCDIAPSIGVEAAQFSVGRHLKKGDRVYHDPNTRSVFSAPPEVEGFIVSECENPVCGKLFLAKNPKQKTCEGKCREYKSALTRDKNNETGLPQAASPLAGTFRCGGPNCLGNYKTAEERDSHRTTCQKYLSEFVW